MKILNARNARRLAWALVGIHLLLMASIIPLRYDPPIPRVVLIMEVANITVWILLGTLIVSRHPRNSVGWIWVSLPIFISLDLFSSAYLAYGYRPGAGSMVGLEAAVLWEYIGGHGIAVRLITLLFLLFPNGYLLSRRWRWVGWLWLFLTIANVPLSIISPRFVGEPIGPTNLLGLSDSFRDLVSPYNSLDDVLSSLLNLVAFVSLLVRLRRSRGVERQQLKWFVPAASLFPPTLVAVEVSFVLDIRPLMLFAFALGQIAFTAIAIASGIAILKYRLFDIDIIIRRTLVYALLSGTLTVLYFGTVTLLQSAFRGLSGQSSSVAIVLSTLLIAVLFSPVRRRAQRFINRRFYRRKYDAAVTLAKFAGNVRNEVDLEQLTAELLHVVRDTMGPESLSIWLKKEE